LNGVSLGPHEESTGCGAGVVGAGVAITGGVAIWLPLSTGGAVVQLANAVLAMRTARAGKRGSRIIDQASGY
jgi:hypothetical protein